MTKKELSGGRKDGRMRSEDAAECKASSGVDKKTVKAIVVIF